MNDTRIGWASAASRHRVTDASHEAAPRLRPDGSVPTDAGDPHGFGAQLVDDVTQICQRVQYVELAPSRLWEPGLVSELADASDRLAVKVAKLQEAQGADR